jgi:hypothetical protein
MSATITQTLVAYDSRPPPYNGAVERVAVESRFGFQQPENPSSEPEGPNDTDSTEASVQQLAHTIRNIRTNFYSEAQTLHGFDIMRFRGNDGNVLVLRPPWDALRKVVA